MKIKVLFLILTLTITLLTGCGTNNEPETNEPDTNQPEENQPDTNEPETNEPETNEPDETNPDVMTTPSLVNEQEPFIQAISADGTWIIAILSDLTIDQDIVMEGEFRDKDDPNNDLYRKLALYAQDEDHNVTAEYTLTAPKITIKSPNTRFQNGTFVGDIYVEANGFNLNNTKVQGNIYFASEEYQSSFTNDGGSVSGTTELK